MMLNALLSVALFPPALLQAAPSSGASSGTVLMIEFGFMIAIGYMLIIRPQQQQRKKHETSLRALKRGDEVVTAGGIVGEVIHIKETSKDGGANRMDDRVTIKSGESRLVVERGRIARIVGSTSAPSEPVSSSASGKA